jgi:hypothetical protein
MNSKPMLLAAALAASACATAPAGGPAGGTAGADARPATLTDAQGRKYRVVCQMERPTGSNISEKVCRTVLEVADPAASQLQDDLLKSNAGRVQLRSGSGS